MRILSEFGLLTDERAGGELAGGYRVENEILILSDLIVGFVSVFRDTPPKPAIRLCCDVRSALLDWH
jgi:hypothetical protein